MQIVRYCPKCGNTDVGLTKSCIFCSHETFDTKYTINDMIKIIDFDKKIIDEYASKSPEFDEELARKRQQEEYNVAHGFMSKEERTVLQNMGAIPKPNTNRVECPYCHSNDVSKISTFGRAASVGIFGLASKKIGKQWRCNHCKSDF